MFCALSGEAPEFPVVSKKTGHLFEKRLIEKYLADNGVDPITNEEMTLDDLVAVKLVNKVAKPRAPSASSVPTLLLTLQNEWDSVVLETYQLKQQYHNVRQELSRALYENDAAKRVIARVMRERDEARQALSNVRAAYGGSETAGAVDMEVDDAPNAMAKLPENDIETINVKAGTLMSARKGKKKATSPTLALTEDIAAYTELYNVPSLHSATNPGIRCLDLFVGDFHSAHRELVATGGSDGTVTITDIGNKKVLATGKAAGGKRMTSVLFHGRCDKSKAGSFFTTGGDRKVRFWSLKAEETVIDKPKWEDKSHKGEVTGIAVHPTGDYYLTSSSDSTWSIGNVHTGKTLLNVKNPDLTHPAYTTAQYHPDGLFHALGTADSTVQIWDVRTPEKVGAFADHVGKVRSVSFSENGYHLATAADGAAVVKFWDLRKLAAIHTLTVETPNAQSIGRIAFDYSGQYFGLTCGSELRLYLAKKWTQIGSHSFDGELTGLQWGPDAKYVVTSGMDRRLVVTGVKE
ncbi:WD40-repeat-containing domain protein [Blyttiomyces helicus]|uniref:Pre-mRNA-processing factor 19 n=1 Tax=Blyttiomyces helicus TaxID=388810 RepID=A0A4P9WEL8_9FUNG|nr:WD40-repeat-containing domain protein [Blyttiomyces helicus]|eukprot:RKO89430.1 WD40-repeat-containing domain protein [Blyttiomyces helicus]